MLSSLACLLASKLLDLAYVVNPAVSRLRSPIAISQSLNIEWSAALLERARLHAVLSELARLAVLDRLLLGDTSPGELGQALGLLSNQLAHHVKWLEQAGLLERSRSESDHRRTYLPAS